MSNRHPVDRLADIREQMAELKTEESEIRNALINGADRNGDEHLAIVTSTTRARLDTKAVERHFGKSALKKFYASTEMHTVKTVRKPINKVGLFD